MNESIESVEETNNVPWKPSKRDAWQVVLMVLALGLAAWWIVTAPKRAEVTETSAGDMLVWDTGLCTATEIGEYVWATAAHCLEKAPLKLLVRVGTAGWVHTNERHENPQYSTGDTKNDIGVVGSPGDADVNLGSIDDLEDDDEILIVASQPYEKRWVMCRTKKKWAEKMEDHWHVMCGLDKGASGSGVWSGDTLLGVVSTREGEWNGVAEARELLKVLKPN